MENDDDLIDVLVHLVRSSERGQQHFEHVQVNSHLPTPTRASTYTPARNVMENNEGKRIEHIIESRTRNEKGTHIAFSRRILELFSGKLTRIRICSSWKE